MLKEEITPENLLNYLNNQEDIKEKKYYESKNLNIKNQDFIQEIKSLNEKIEELLDIVESEDFKSLNLNNAEEKKLHNSILEELQIYKDKIEILQNAEKNYNDMKEKQIKKMEKNKNENLKNIFKENFKLYEKFKKEKMENLQIPEFFKFIFSIFDKININKTEEEQIEEFIKLYNIYSQS